MFVMHCEAKNASFFGLFSFFFFFTQNLQWSFLTKTNFLTILFSIHALKNQIIIIIIIFEFLIEFILKKFKFEWFFIFLFKLANFKFYKLDSFSAGNGSMSPVTAKTTAPSNNESLVRTGS